MEASIHTNSLNTTNTNHRVGPDIEMNNTGDKFHTGSSTSEALKVNGNRLSERITNFIENKNGGGAPRFNSNNSSSNNHSSTTAVDPTSNSGFIRPMSPVEVDYPSHQPRSFTPTHQFSEKSSLARNVSVDDPYTNASVNFTMMDPPSLAGKRYNSDGGRISYERSTTPLSLTSRQQLGQEYQMQTMNQQDDFRFSRDSYDYTGTQKSNSNYQTPGGRI